ncbi:MAG TPA: phosphotransferase [Vicinamibacterales bacterium]
MSSALASTTAQPGTSPLPAPNLVSGNAREDLLKQLGLEFDATISDDGGSFVTMACHDATGRRMVLKYLQRASADARRRLHNETVLVKHLPARRPLRLLTHRSSGPEYLLTEFDSGALLYPDALDSRTIETVAGALARFQSMRPDLERCAIADREKLSTYYLKVLFKNLLHLWPAHISATEAVRCQAIVSQALRAICRQTVICHGDFLPTNLLHHREDDSVTFTDLEGFISANHPLFDVLAFCSISSLDVNNWEWQRHFLSQYFEAARETLGLDPRARDYRTAYRGILIFFLVYRLSEQRMGLSGGAYFDGVGKRRFLVRKARGLVAGRRASWHDDAIGAALDIRKRNLRRALSRSSDELFEAMHATLKV